MLFTIVKILISSAIIALVTELARKLPSIGGIIAALPMISILSLVWLSIQGSDNSYLVTFSKGVLQGLPATFLFILAIYIALKVFESLPISLIVGLLIWLITIFVPKVL